VVGTYRAGATLCLVISPSVPQPWSYPTRRTVPGRKGNSNPGKGYRSEHHWKNNVPLKVLPRHECYSNGRRSHNGLFRCDWCNGVSYIHAEVITIGHRQVAASKLIPQLPQQGRLTGLLTPVRPEGRPDQTPGRERLM